MTSTGGTVNAPSAPSGQLNDSNESDREEEQECLPKTPGIRAKQTALFSAWLASPSTQQALATPLVKHKGTREGFEHHSTHDLLAHSRDIIINSPRDYQLELFARAKEQNTIAVLDTGSGKTLIAILLLRWIYEQELEERARGHVHKLSFYLVCSVTLAYQQHSVLENNLDIRVARVCGSDNVDQWDREKWKKLFADYDIIVCTAAVLQQCLTHGHMQMHQINLLVFDEAHHTKRNHAYARIMKDFYTLEDTHEQPRVFSMTASPIDGKGDVDVAAKELESHLHSSILTTPNMSLSDASCLPSEVIKTYPSSSKAPPNSRIFRIMRDSPDASSFIAKHLTIAQVIFQHLGSWCADDYLVTCCTGRAIDEFERKMENRHRTLQDPDEQDISAFDKRVADLRSVKTTAIDAQWQRAGPDNDSLTPKVQILQDLLRDMFEHVVNCRCIVFVKECNTAILLSKVFGHLNLKHLKPGYLIGRNSRDEDGTISLRRQILSLTGFRKGQINCLFATSVAEEGLDIPDCNAVIRFDLYDTMIQYIQSRGRARHPQSRYIHMLEMDNVTQQELHKDVHDHERAMRAYIQSLPRDRILCDGNALLADLLEEEAYLKVHTEPSTGARLTFGHAMVCLANFVSAIPQRSEESVTPTYSIKGSGQLFVVEVFLPDDAPIRSCIGQPQRRKILAKQSAAFEACIQLRKRGFLDENLLPTYRDKLPKMRNALLATGIEKKDRYTMKTKPSVWAQMRGAVPIKLWMTVIDFPSGLGMEHRPILLLTRSKMPNFPIFPIYLNDGTASEVHAISASNPVDVTHDLLTKLTTFTCCVFADVFSKTFQNVVEDMSYWFAPGCPIMNTEDVSSQSVLDLSTLDIVCSASIGESTTSVSPDALVNKFIIDPCHGGLKYYSQSIATHLKATDHVPKDGYVHIRKGKSKSNDVPNIAMNSSAYLGSNVRDPFECEGQPVIKAEMVQMRRDVLAMPTTIGQAQAAYICPGLLRVSPLPLANVVACQMLPGIIHRFESYLIALESCELLGIECRLDLALAAITKHTHDDDNEAEVPYKEDVQQIRVRGGMGENYERLEFIGDTFLKLATTLAVFVKCPDDNEFESHVKRMVMLCNKTLYNSADREQLYQYVRSKVFSRRTWYPEGLTLIKGKKIHTQGESARTHSLSQKTLADVCEALIGAAFMSHDKPGAWEPAQWQAAIRAVKVFVHSNDHEMEKWEDYRAAYRIPPSQTANASAVEIQLASQTASSEGYSFRYPRLLRTAFTHPSMPRIGDGAQHYERLEFLGDALLDMVVVSHLFNRFPDKDEQWLTEHKMALVSNRFLSALCVELDFHKHLRVCSADIPGQITEYVTELTETRKVTNAAPDYWVSVSAPPKCLADIVEAYVGGMFIDSGFDYNEVQRFFDQHMAPRFEDMSLFDTYANQHPGTRLQNLLEHTFNCKGLSIMTREVPDILPSQKKQAYVAVVMVHDAIVTHERSESLRYGKERVAKEAFKIMEGMVLDDFRTRFGCDCRGDAADG